jgi:hypothetical protein
MRSDESSGLWLALEPGEGTRGVPLTRRRLLTPGVPHVSQAYAAVLDEGAAALDRSGAFLREHMAGIPHGDEQPDRAGIPAR